jgi:hypothetical protein
MGPHDDSFHSPVNDILDKETFTLVELLQEDEILQEVKARNGRLIDLYVHISLHILYYTTLFNTIFYTYNLIYDILCF